MKLEDLTIQTTRQVVRDELERIKSKSEDGLLKVEVIVDTARHPDSPLHKFFEWDDSAAAEAYRQTQARQLVRLVKVTSSSNGERQQLPKYVSLMSDRQQEGGGYRSTEEVTESPDLLAELEATAKRELESWVRRHAVLTALVEKVRAAAGLGKKPAKKKPQAARR